MAHFLQNFPSLLCSSSLLPTQNRFSPSPVLYFPCSRAWRAVPFPSLLVVLTVMCVVRVCVFFCVPSSPWLWFFFVSTHSSSTCPPPLLFRAVSGWFFFRLVAFVLPMFLFVPSIWMLLMRSNIYVAILFLCAFKDTCAARATTAGGLE